MQTNSFSNIVKLTELTLFTLTFGSMPSFLVGGGAGGQIGHPLYFRIVIKIYNIGYDFGKPLLQ